MHFTVRLQDDRLCTLVMIGARPDGTKELIAVEDGYRESAESWKTVLRDLKRRRMRAPVIAVGDGALGFRAAVRDVWPKTRAQRDWFHKLDNVQRDRIAVRDGARPPARDEGRGFADEGAGDGLEAARHGGGPVATARRRAPPPARACVVFVDGMEVTGHRTRPVFDRYNISSSDDMRAALAALGTYTEQAAAKRAVVQVAGLNSDNLSESREAAAS